MALKEVQLTFKSTEQRDRVLDAHFTSAGSHRSGSPGVTTQKFAGQRCTRVVFCEKVWVYWRDGNMSPAAQEEFTKRLALLRKGGVKVGAIVDAES